MVSAFGREEIRITPLFIRSDYKLSHTGDNTLKLCAQRNFWSVGWGNAIDFVYLLMQIYPA